MGGPRQVFTGLKKLLPKVFIFLKLLTNGVSRDTEMSEHERTIAITMIIANFFNVYFYSLHIWYAICVSAF
jgi:hypothetical protein